MAAQTPHSHSILGKSHVRKGVPEKATGAAKYTADISFPGMLEGAVLCSPLAHARILNIDTSQAEKLPGVKAVITAKDTGDHKWGHSPARYDETTLAVDKVRHIGDQIAAVAAVDEQTAKEAVERIIVDYEELPAVFDPVDALAKGAPVIHDRFPDNLTIQVHNHFGDVEKAFAKAHHIRTDRFVNSKTDGLMMEPQACVAKPDLSGKLTLWTSTQVSHYVQRTLAIALKMPVDHIRVIAPNVGGGFGPKASTHPYEPITCFLARATRRPVRLALDREQVFWHNRARHKYVHEMKTAVDKNGYLLALDHLSVLDGGAYSSFGVITAYYNGSLLTGPYKLPNMKYDGFRVYTNKPASGSLRGHGGVSNRACFEAQLDMIAQDLNIDPIDLRLKNKMGSNDVTCCGYYTSNLSVGECLEAARAKSKWNKKKGKLPRGKGIGVGTGFFVSGAGACVYRSEVPHSAVMLRVSDDGRQVTAYSGSNELGQGSDTVIAMITAEVLGLSVDDIRVISGDTGQCPVDLGAYSSRQTLMTGHATKKAAEAIKARIIETIAEIFEMPADTFTLRDGAVQGTEQNPEKLKIIRDRYRREHRAFVDLPTDGPLTFQEINRYMYNAGGPVISKGTYAPGEIQEFKDWKGSAVGSSPAYSTQTCIAEVTVDFDTGKLSVDKVTLAHDCGFALNRTAVEGQMEGSMCHGLSETLFEEMLFDDKGQLINRTLGDYKIATALDVPELEAVIVETHEPAGPFGAKEVGEGCIIPVLPAIINAVNDACGAVIMDLPVTSEKILMALKAKEAQQTDRFVTEIPPNAKELLDMAREITKAWEESIV